MSDPNWSAVGRSDRPSHLAPDEQTWLAQAERKLREAIYESLARGDWQAVYEDALIGKAVFGRKEAVA